MTKIKIILFFFFFGCGMKIILETRKEWTKTCSLRGKELNGTCPLSSFLHLPRPNCHWRTLNNNPFLFIFENENWYTDAISGGKSSIQTWNWENLHADLASLWATLFPCLRVWQKDKFWKAEENKLMSLMMCPKLEESNPPMVNALMIVSESPLIIT